MSGIASGSLGHLPSRGPAPVARRMAEIDQLEQLRTALTDRYDVQRSVGEGEAAANPADGNWGTFVGGRSMVFGAEVTQVFQENMPFAGVAWRWGLIYDANPPSSTTWPSGSNDDALIVELCPLSLSTNPAYRIGRHPSSGSETVLQAGDIAGYCNVTALRPAPTGVLARALHGVLDLFTPAPLQALMFAPPGIGDSSGGTSDYAVVDAGAVHLAYTTQPVDGFVNTPIPIVVRGTPNNGTPLENVAITLAIAGNQGTNVVLTGGEPVCTDENGVASFSISINKTGGYQVNAMSGFSGLKDVTITSNLFNLQQNP